MRTVFKPSSFLLHITHRLKRPEIAFVLVPIFFVVTGSLTGALFCCLDCESKVLLRAELCSARSTIGLSDFCLSRP